MAVEKWKQHFDLSSIDNDRINGCCKLCQQNYKDKIGVSSNFLKHLKRKHKDEYEKLFIIEGEDSSDDIGINNDHRSTTELPSNNSKQNRINVSITKNLIIKCNLPLSLVENAAFREFMKECNYKWNRDGRSNGFDPRGDGRAGRNLSHTPTGRSGYGYRSLGAIRAG